MPGELERRRSPRRASGTRRPEGAEALSVVLFSVTLLFVMIASLLSVWSSQLSGESAASPGGWSVAFAVLGVTFAITGLTRPRTLYFWLRQNRARQLAPAAGGALTVLVTGPDSPGWWLALGLLLLTTSLASPLVSLIGATATATAFLLGTVVAARPVIGFNELADSVGLVAYTTLGASISQAIERFVLNLGLHPVERAETSAPADAPRQSEQPRPQPPALHAGSRPLKPPRPPDDPTRPSSRLTPSQLEAVRLAGDGHKQPEIAREMRISVRQVARLLDDARERTGAATTPQLVAMLVTDRFAPAPQNSVPRDPPPRSDAEPK